jgi:hypothetical protein
MSDQNQKQLEKARAVALLLSAGATLLTAVTGAALAGHSIGWW